MGPAWRVSYVRYRSLFLRFFSHYKDRQDVKMYLEVLLSLATISFFAILALRPTLITIAELIKEIESKEQTLAIMDSKIQDLSAAQTRYDQELRKIRLVNSSIPTLAEPELIVRQIEGLTARSSVSVLSMITKEATLLGKDNPKTNATIGVDLPDGSKELGISIGSSAQYPDLLNFLSDLERTRRPVKINNINISTQETTEGSVLIMVIGALAPYLVETSTRPQ